MENRNFFDSKRIFGVAILLALGVQVAVAATVKIANEPLNQLTLVKPNLMVTMDNSGSMQQEYMPDGQSSTAIGTRNNYNRNTLYYNPNLLYKPAVFADGTSMPSQTAANTCGTGTCEFTTPWTKVLNNPYLNIATSGVALSAPGTANITNFTNGNAYPAAGGYPALTRAPFYCTVNCGADRVDIRPGATYPKVATRTDCSGAVGPNGCSYAEEMTNFANWYAYYRSRYQMAKAAVGQVFAELDDNYRIGLHTIGNSAQASNGIFWLYADIFASGDATKQKNKFFYNMYRFNDGNATPLRAASVRIGEYFRAPTVAQGDPIQYWCQRNFHLLVTDGYWNESTYNKPTGAPTIPNDIDKIVPTLPFKDDGTSNRVAITGLTTGDNWPRPFYDASGAPNVGGPTLADIGMYYWVNDLRPNHPADPKAKNGLTGSTANPATWQHLVFYGIGLGVQGTRNNPGDLPALTSGALNWPNPVNNNSPSAVDDLWHAAINGHGAYFSATDPSSLVSSLLGVIANINAQSAAGTAGGRETPVLTNAGNVRYQTTYTSGKWYGEMKAKVVDPLTGKDVSTTALWNALTKLDQQTQPTPLMLPSRGYVSSNRRIVTYSGTGGIPFQWTSLTSTQRAAIVYKTLAEGGSPLRTGADVVNFLRGDPTHEGTTLGKFRERGDTANSVYGVLGDIVNFEPIVVGPPREEYTEAYNPGYESFSTSIASRTPMVYVGANDGMLHAFNASLGPYDQVNKTFAPGTNMGREEWAYVPGLLIRATNDENGNPDGIQSLTLRPDVNPRFRHHFFVDSTPVRVDADFSGTWNGSSWSHDANYVNTAATKDWRTVLIGGLGKGGKGYYAVDVTNGASGGASETAATSKILWEFTDANMGYTFGTPVVARTRAYGWVAIFPSGFNNADGVGYIYVVNVKTGQLLKKLSIPAGYGTSATPANLAHIAAFSSNADNFLVDQVYGGDTLGNFWRFDLSDPNPGNWTTAALVATFWSPSPVATGANYNGTQRQPITSKPAFYVDKYGNRWVIVGTGIDMHQNDRDINQTMTNQIQTVYSFKDGSNSSPAVGAPITRNDLVAKTRTLISGVTVGANAGWYMDLAAPDASNPTIKYGAERVLNGPSAEYGAVTIDTSIAVSDVCTPGAEGNLYQLDMLTGESVLVDDSGNSIPYKHFAGGLVPRSKIVKTADGKTVVISCDSAGNCVKSECKGGQCAGGVAAGRVSWREIVR